MVTVAILDDLTQRFAAAFAKMPGLVAAGIVLALYPGIGLAVPLSLHMSRPGLVAMNLVGATWAFVVSIGWLGVLVDAGRRRCLVEWSGDLRNLNPDEFELLVGEMFRREGWTVRETGEHGVPDGNIDLELSRNHQRRLVQCKRWSAKPVNVDDIRGFAGTLLREGLPGHAGFFVTLSTFTPQARAEAEQIGLSLLDGRELYARIEQVRRAEPCPKCQRPMTLSRSTYGWWFRCTASGCGGKRDLGRDPGRVVELLAPRE
jgi:Restriction endonuclease